MDQAKAPKTGTLKFFNRQRRHGFILQDASKRSLFCSIEAFAVPDEGAAAKGGQRVSYDVQTGDRGDFAANVRVFG